MCMVIGDCLHCFPHNRQNELTLHCAGMGFRVSGSKPHPTVGQEIQVQLFFRLSQLRHIVIVAIDDGAEFIGDLLTLSGGVLILQKLRIGFLFSGIQITVRVNQLSYPFLNLFPAHKELHLRPHRTALADFQPLAICTGIQFDIIQGGRWISTTDTINVSKLS